MGANACWRKLAICGELTADPQTSVQRNVAGTNPARRTLPGGYQNPAFRLEPRLHRRHPGPAARRES